MSGQRHASPAQRLTAALCGIWNDRVGTADCPVHQGPGLTVRDGDRTTLVSCDAGCNRRTIVDVLRRRSLWPAGDAHQ